MKAQSTLEGVNLNFMKRRMFFDQIKDILVNAKDLGEVEQKLNKKAEELQKRGLRVGMVVGKISPSLEGETLESNKAILTQKTLEIAKLVEKEGILVFSSAALPDSIEGKFPRSDHYRVFENFVRRYVKVIFTTPGWESSKGATGEVAIAKDNNIPIRHYSSGSLRPEKVA